MPQLTSFGTSIVTSGGVPVVGGGAILTTGNVFFVDSSHALAANDNVGDNPGLPLRTIDAAVGKCTANNGDFIIVGAGHVETISAASSLDVDVAGVTIIGCGQGMTRPILDFTNTAGTVDMAAANCRLSNMIVRANVSAVVVGINVDADHVELDHLFFTFDATGDDFVWGIDVDAVDYAHIHDCVFNGEITTGADNAIRLDDAHYVRIENNTFYGQWAEAVVLNEGALCENLTIKNNVMYNADTSVYNGIDVGTLSTTGIVANNRITALYATVVTKVFRDGDLTSMNNYFVNAVSERGTMAVPATTSA